MDESTVSKVESVLKSDATMTDEQRERIVAVLRGVAGDCILRPSEVCAILHVKKCMVYYYGRRGFIRRVTLSGKRAIGYSAASVAEFLRKRTESGKEVAHVA